MRRAAGLLAAPLCICLRASVAGAAPPSPHEIAVQLHGPVALVEVTRELPADTDRPATSGRPAERVLDVALPEGAALVDVAVSERGRWRATTTEPLERATRDYVDRLERRSLAPGREPFDESTSVRIRVTADAGVAPRLRYRFALLPETSGGRRRIRFPPSPERLPVPADVALTGAGTKDVDVAGTHAARAHVSTRGSWELSWAPPPAEGGARVAASVAVARTSRTETLAAVSVEARAAKPVEAPGNVLFVIDRSRSVGLPGLAAERDLAGRLLEALPPSTRFEALFFDRQVGRLFRAPRPATREALSALEAEMVPDRLQNGTDVAGALREAGALLRREAVGFRPRALLVLVTDGALPDGRDGEALVRALGDTPGVELAIAAFVVRPGGDDPAAPEAVRALRHLAAARGGLLRELTANELGDAIPAALDALARGGDVAELRLAGAGDRALATHLPPGEGHAALLRLPDDARATELVGTAGGARVHLSVRARRIDAAWLRALAAPPSPSDARLFASDAVVALVEQPARAAPPASDVVRGSLDRTVVRNTLSLAYMPRARACYLNRTAKTKAERDLAGRVRLAIDFTRGEVGGAVIQSSTLNHPGVEACLREGAFAIDVPRTLRSDSPSTAVLNLVFRPRTPERPETPEEAALGAQIDLVIEEASGAASGEASGAASGGGDPADRDEPPAPDRSMIPTR
ncbi:MAG TPA: VWA domain-containing protein [Polyangia bacterium]|nr:VWA domain-containing protein [Polyangia bacterium]